MLSPRESVRIRQDAHVAYAIWRSLRTNGRTQPRVAILAASGARTVAAGAGARATGHVTTRLADSVARGVPSDRGGIWVRPGGPQSARSARRAAPPPGRRISSSAAPATFVPRGARERNDRLG